MDMLRTFFEQEQLLSMFPYDRKPSIGQFDKRLDEAEAKGWTVVNMKNDWKVVLPFDGK